MKYESIREYAKQYAETIAGKPENMIRWVELVRQIGEEVFGSDSPVNQ